MAPLKDSKQGPEGDSHKPLDRGRREEKESMSSFGSGSTRPFDDRFMASHRFDSFSNSDANSPAGYDVFSSQVVPETQSPPSLYLAGGGFSKQNDFGGGLGTSEPEEGFALREWRRRNAIELEEKEKKEKEKLQQIIEEAEAYKTEFYRKRRLNVEKNKASNRVTERVFVENQEKFHAEAEKSYWKAIAELIPREVAAIEKRGKKEQANKGSIVVIHGPKPGKPTDLSRMRQILVKLKQSPPSQRNPKP